MILLRGGTVVTMDVARTVRRADVLVEDGRIARIGEFKPPRGAGIVDCAGKAVLPGLIQAHVHLCQTLFRNQADGLDLLDWLEQRIWPFEAAHDDRSLAGGQHAARGRQRARPQARSSQSGRHARRRRGELGAQARDGLGELRIRCGQLGVTVRHTEAVLRAAEESGIRYTGGKCLIDTGPDPLREDGAAAMEEAEILGRKWHGAASGRIRWALCPRFALSCTPVLLRKIRDLGAREGWLVHTHASENRREVDLVRQRTGKDNVAWLNQAGLCGPRTVLAHCVHVTPEEVHILANTSTSVAHCPGANLKLASGYAPLPRMLAARVNVALGADGAACNNALDVFHEMRLAATMHLPKYGAAAMSPAEVLAMATVRGAQALGLANEIGSIETGKKADITVLDVSAPHFQPAGDDLHATIVHCARGSDVTDVIVDGRIVVRDRRLLTLNAGKLAAAASSEAGRLLGAVRTKSKVHPEGESPL